MKRILKFFYLTIASIVLILIITNPSPKKFKENLPVITKVPNVFFRVKESAQYITYGRQKNYFVFSKYYVHFALPPSKSRILKENYKVLGIFGNFYILNSYND